MPQPIPSYLIALGVGDLAFQPARSEDRHLGRAFAVGQSGLVRICRHREAMIEATEKLGSGLIDGVATTSWSCPPVSRSAGWKTPGSHSPRRPSVIAGDRSLVALVAHELAHSWSGQPGHQRHLARLLAERRVHGLSRTADRRGCFRGGTGQASRPSSASRSFAKTWPGCPSPDQILHIQLDGRDPDDGMTQVPYEKGALVPHARSSTGVRPRPIRSVPPKNTSTGTPSRASSTERLPR